MYMCYGEVSPEMTKDDFIYFLRTGDGMVPLPNSIDEADEQLPAAFEVGVLTSSTLLMLEQVITQVGLRHLH